jgi:hypothetical protein
MGGMKPAWSRTELFFVTPEGAVMAAPVAATGRSWPEAAGQPSLVLEPGYYMGEGNPDRNYDVSPDGRRLLMIRRAGDVSAAVPPTIMVVQNWKICGGWRHPTDGSCPWSVDRDGGPRVAAGPSRLRIAALLAAAAVAGLAPAPIGDMLRRYARRRIRVNARKSSRWSTMMLRTISRLSVW